MYIPKNRIKTNLYTAGGEYVFKGNQEEYKGYFHSLYDGTFYTGRTPNDPPIVEIINILNSSNAQIEADVVDLPYQYFADNYDGVVFDGQIQDVKAAHPSIFEFCIGIKHTLGSDEICPGIVSITFSSLSISSKFISNVNIGVSVVLSYNKHLA